MMRKTIIRTISFKMAPLLFVAAFLYVAPALKAQNKEGEKKETAVTDGNETHGRPKVYYGTASFYADKFNGRETASGQIYYHNVPSAACNILPLGTWIRVTNLKNERSVIVRVNDRLHPRMRRIVDLNKDSAVKLGYVSKGLEEVKVEVLGVKKPKNSI